MEATRFQVLGVRCRLLREMENCDDLRQPANALTLLSRPVQFGGTLPDTWDLLDGPSCKNSSEIASFSP
jgi:hypothetical protein